MIGLQNHHLHILNGKMHCDCIWFLSQQIFYMLDIIA